MEGRKRRKAPLSRSKATYSENLYHTATDTCSDIFILAKRSRISTEAAVDTSCVYLFRLSLLPAVFDLTRLDPCGHKSTPPSNGCSVCSTCALWCVVYFLSYLRIWAVNSIEAVRYNTNLKGLYTAEGHGSPSRTLLRGRSIKGHLSE